MGDLRRDLDRYHRSLRLKNHFKNDTNVVTDGSSIGPFNDTFSLKLQSKSKWNPPMGSSNLETIITMNKLRLQDSIPECPKKKNISDDQTKALKELSSNADIVIKPADKGGATVVQNRSDYVAEGLRQLSDQNYYRPLDDNLTDGHNCMVMSNLDTMRRRGEITERAARYLVLRKHAHPNCISSLKSTRTFSVTHCPNRSLLHKGYGRLLTETGKSRQPDR